MPRRIFIFVFAASLISMLISSYVLVTELQSNMREEAMLSEKHIERLKHTVRVHDYLLKINSQKTIPVGFDEQINTLNQLMLDENPVINRNDLRFLRSEIATMLNMQTVPERRVINSWLTGSILNDMIELEKDYLPTQQRIAPIIVMTDTQWSALLGILWTSSILAALSLGGILGGLPPMKRLPNS